VLAAAVAVPANAAELAAVAEAQVRASTFPLHHQPAPARSAAEQAKICSPWALERAKGSAC